MPYEHRGELPPGKMSIVGYQNLTGFYGLSFIEDVQTLLQELTRSS
jgi:hypothetical protein